MTTPDDTQWKMRLDWFKEATRNIALVFADEPASVKTLSDPSCGGFGPTGEPLPAPQEGGMLGIAVMVDGELAIQITSDVPKEQTPTQAEAIMWLEAAHDLTAVLRDSDCGEGGDEEDDDVLPAPTWGNGPRGSA